MDKELTPDEIIDALGGTSEVAELCEVGASAVSQWRNSRNGIPKPQMKYLRLARPEIFAALDAAISASAAPAPDHAMRQPPSRANVMEMAAGQVAVYEVVPKAPA